MYFYLQWVPALYPVVLSYPLSFSLSYLSPCSPSCCQNKVNPLRKKKKKTGSPIGNVWQVGTTRLLECQSVSPPIQTHTNQVQEPPTHSRERQRKGGKEREEEGVDWGRKIQRRGQLCIKNYDWKNQRIQREGRKNGEGISHCFKAINCSLIGSIRLAVALPGPAATTVRGRLIPSSSHKNRPPRACGQSSLLLLPQDHLLLCNDPCKSGARPVNLSPLDVLTPPR